MFRLSDKLFLLLAVNFIFGEYLASAECPADRQKPWSFDSNLPNGPGNWGKKYPECNGKTQSPINIETLYVEAESTNALHLVGYDKPITKFNIENTGYTVQISPKDGVSRAMQINGHTYSLDSFHFHWGANFYEGAEHSINGIAGAIELHLVHKDTSGNLAVLGVISDVSAFGNQGLTPIVNYLPKVKYENDQIKVDGSDNRKVQIHLTNLLPGKSPYYIYNGSLTTPPCSPNVIWVVCDHHSYLALSQIVQFRELVSTTEKNAGSGRNCNLVNNFRPIQRRNNRKVSYYANLN